MLFILALHPCPLSLLLSRFLLLETCRFVHSCPAHTMGPIAMAAVSMPDLCLCPSPVAVGVPGVPVVDAPLRMGVNPLC